MEKSTTQFLKLCSILILLIIASTLFSNTTLFHSDLHNAKENHNISYTSILDANFEQVLIDLGVDTEGILDGQILVVDAEATTNLNISNSNISDLTGIAAFINLADLNCSTNQLTTLDLSNNIALTNLDCFQNLITDLDLTNNTLLAVLNCANNQIQSLDLSIHSALTFLYCYNNLLTYLNIKNGNNTNITFILTTGNFLTCMDVDNPVYSNANWPIFVDPITNFSTDCSSFYTLTPDTNFEQKLIDLGIDTEGVLDGRILTFDAEATNTLDVSNCNISDLTGIEDFIILTELDCSDNQLTILDLSTNDALTKLWCQNNGIMSIDMSDNSWFLELDCEQIAPMDLTIF